MKNTPVSTLNMNFDIEELRSLLSEAIALFPPLPENDIPESVSLYGQLGRIQMQVMNLQQGIERISKL